MHVLFLASYFPNRVRKTVGIFMQNHAHAISQKFNVTVLSLEKDNSISNSIEIFREKRGSLDVFIIYYKPKKKGLFLLNKILIYSQILKSIFKVVKLIEFEKSIVNFVHVNVCHPIGVIALFLKFFYSKKYYITEHSSLYLFDHFKKHSFIGKLLIRLIYKYSSGLSVVTKYLGDSIKALGIYKKPYYVIPNVVSTKLFNINNKQLNNDIPTFIHVSSLIPMKGVDSLIDACKVLVDKCLSFKFIIVGGNGVYLKHVKDKVLGLNMENFVQVTGELSSNEISLLLKRSDFFVLNSDYETFSVVMIEAIASGLPIIAPNNSAIPENLNAKRGVLLNDRSPEVWAEAIIQMIENKNYFNQKELHEFVKDTFSMDSISRKFEKFFND